MKIFNRGSKAQQLSIVLAALTELGVDLSDCKTEEDVAGALEALVSADDHNALEADHEKALDRIKALETDLTTAKADGDSAKKIVAAVEAKLGKLGGDAADKGKTSEKSETSETSEKDKAPAKGAKAEDGLEASIAAAVVAAVGAHYKAAGSGVEQLSADTGSQASDEQLEEPQTEAEFMTAIGKAKSEEERDKLHASMRKKFPL